ncbi:hypothetical protein [uncultured Thiodictyon sp.]|uniref:hypothetical protein n=1 Tax=uncultured Thiodictyon sp. TaxID=1846217 RepID=UPI0025F72BB1|nr:hypothetical protein [uncultured Thiodictyon sp.]
MLEDRDRYAAYYTERLWGLLPAVYRAADPDDDGTPGPLRELVGRLGAQIAVVRRGIDRSLEDQSIETCDDWLIPYLGELLATNLVDGLGARGQRLDVANTIYYRRRKGTVALLEELAADIAGWNARVVECFRRLARTRHQFDPPLGEDREQALIAGLIGARSLTPAGGFADLRDAAAAAATHGAFDEFLHTADCRRGRAHQGWYNIPKLAVFLWRLKSYGCRASTPVPYALCPQRYTFDPTGRETPLFARNVRDQAQYGDTWVTPDAWMLPGPLDATLWRREAAHLYPDSLAVLRLAGSDSEVLDAAAVQIEPAQGRFRLAAPPPAGVAVQTAYHYGFSSELGAGPYDRRVLGDPLPAQPQPLALAIAGGGDALVGALAALGATGTLAIADSLTYDAVADRDGIADLLIRGADNERPVVRLAGTAWRLTGVGPKSRLTLEGLLVSGADLVLCGEFEQVTLFCSTLDPGEEADAVGALPLTVDGRTLRPTTLWIEGTVAKLTVERSIVGPIRTRGTGTLARLDLVDSIAQGVRTSGTGPFAAADLLDPWRLAARWQSAQDPLTAFIRQGALAAALAAYDPAAPPTAALSALILATLNALVGGGPLYEPARFAAVALPPGLLHDALAVTAGADLVRINRLLLETAYLPELAPASVASREVEVSLQRSTCLGALYAHRIDASESVLAGFARAADTQSGCVRCCAYSEGSPLHQPYESVAIREPCAIFASRRFGDPDYAQLGPWADREILAGAPGATLLAGARNGAEMGAFAREGNPIKERALRIKLGEFMPIGLTPVLIYMT